ncbi:hypothetical protein AO735_10685 [Pseudomonas sp. TTU2014-096BSC]|nr:hypothetical protein AO735_10685 [Pseudomonas sp. TTU2014-096BSC]
MGLLERLPFQNIKNKRQDYLKTKQLKPFIDKHLPRKSREIISAHDLQKLVRDEEFDAVVVGSDQVWRYQYIGDGHHSVFFLDFDVDYPVKKIAYAASFGKDKWEAPEHIAVISGLLKKFHAISTREESGARLCQDVFGVSGAKGVLDPTMLMGAEFYNCLLNNFPKGGRSKVLVTYMLDQSQTKKDIIATVKSQLGCNENNLQQVNLSGKTVDGFYSVEEWLWHINNAEFIITDSFHGMVFAIIFEKQFLVIGNAERGLSRVTDLLNPLQLNERLLLEGEMPFELLEKKIEYSLISQRIAELRVISERFLHDAIGVGVN